MKTVTKEFDDIKSIVSEFTQKFIDIRTAIKGISNEYSKFTVLTITEEQNETEEQQKQFNSIRDLTLEQELEFYNKHLEGVYIKDDIINLFLANKHYTLIKKSFEIAELKSVIAILSKDKDKNITAIKKLKDIVKVKEKEVKDVTKKINEVHNSIDPIQKRNIELEIKSGKIKNTVKEFEEFYKMNKDKYTVEAAFNEFKNEHECLKNHDWSKYKKTFYYYGGKLK